MIEKEVSPIHQFVTILIEAAKREEWDRIDDELVPQLEGFDGNQMARELLDYKDDEDPNVRDVVATSLTPLAITDERTRNEAIGAMIRCATTDKEKYPAGRAAAFLLKHKKDNDFKVQIKEALNTFKTKAEEENWRDDLVGNIPELEEIL